MKKLMIAAIAAATVGGVFAADTLCEEGVAANGCSVYNVKFSLKTLAAKKKNCTKTLAQVVGFDIWTRYGDKATGATFTSGDFPEATATTTVLSDDYLKTIPAAKQNLIWTGDLYWADNATRTLEGILWQCQAACFEGAYPATGKGAGDIYFVLWEKKTERCFSFPALRRYNADGDKFSWFTADEQPSFPWMGRYGQKAAKIGVEWRPRLYADWIDAVGFGSFDDKNRRIKSVSGGCVASLTPYLVGAEDDCGNVDFFKIQVAYVCQGFKQWCCDQCFAAVGTVPAYGTWSLKYNSSLSKGTKPLSKVIPEYAVLTEDLGVIEPGKVETDVNGIIKYFAGANYMNNEYVANKVNAKL